MLRLIRFAHINPEEVRLDAKPTEGKGIMIEIYNTEVSEGADFELDNAEAKVLSQALNTWLEDKDVRDKG